MSACGTPAAEAPANWQCALKADTAETYMETGLRLGWAVADLLKAE